MIATTLAVFLATLAIGLVGVVVIGAMIDVTQTFDDVIPWVIGIATVAGGAYLVRHDV